MSFTSKALFEKTLDKETLDALRESTDELNQEASLTITTHLPALCLQLYREVKRMNTDPTFLFHPSNDAPSPDLMKNFEDAVEVAKAVGAQPVAPVKKLGLVNGHVNGSVKEVVNGFSSSGTEGVNGVEAAGSVGGKGLADEVDDGKGIETKGEKKVETEQEEMSGFVEMDENLEKLRNSYAPTEAHIARLQEHLHNHATTLLELCHDMQIWIQMVAPPLEEGNPTNVSIQSRCSGGLNSLESFAISHISSGGYSLSRGDMAWKVLKWPGVADYRVALARHDLAECAASRRALKNMHYWAQYIVNLMHKNYGKIEDPSMTSNEGMY